MLALFLSEPEHRYHFDFIITILLICFGYGFLNIHAVLGFAENVKVDNL